MGVLLGLLCSLSCGDEGQDARCVDGFSGCGAPCETASECRSGMLCTPLGCQPAMVTATCVDGDPNCGGSCEADADCAEGMHCGAQGCAKECIPEEMACANLGMCTPEGRCQSTNPDPEAPAPPQVDKRGPGSGDGVVCASTVVTARPVTPHVILVVDQSGSMEENFMGDGTRWNVLREFLLAQEGLIESLQDRIRFGLAMYSAESSDEDRRKPKGECPMVTSVSPAIDNYDAIHQAYMAADPIEDTPTGDAINKILDDLALDTFDPDVVRDPTVFILATDGEPDHCMELDPQNGQERAVSAVKRAYGLKVRTFVISVGDEVSEEHLQDLANAGLGLPTRDETPSPSQADNAEFWVAGNASTLETALTDIIRGALSCEIALDGQIAGGDACADGTVTLNGDELRCGQDPGWELMDDSRIRLVGSACDTLKMGGDAVLEARFPCGVTVLQ